MPRIAHAVDVSADPFRDRVRLGEAVAGGNEAVDEDRFGPVPDHLFPRAAETADRDVHPLRLKGLVHMPFIAVPVAVAMFVVTAWLLRLVISAGLLRLVISVGRHRPGADDGTGRACGQYPEKFHSPQILFQDEIVGVLYLEKTDCVLRVTPLPIRCPDINRSLTSVKAIRSLRACWETVLVNGSRLFCLPRQSGRLSAIFPRFGPILDKESSPHRNPERINMRPVSRVLTPFVRFSGFQIRIALINCCK